MEEERTEKLRVWLEAGSSLLQEVLDERNKLLKIAAAERDTLEAELHQAHEENCRLKLCIAAKEEQFNDRVQELQGQLHKTREELEKTEEELREKKKLLQRKAIEFSVKMLTTERDHRREKTELSKQSDQLREQLGNALSLVDRLREEPNARNENMTQGAEQLLCASSENQRPNTEQSARKAKVEGLLRALHRRDLSEACDVAAKEEKAGKRPRVREQARADGIQRYARGNCSYVQEISPSGPGLSCAEGSESKTFTFNVHHSESKEAAETYSDEILQESPKPSSKRKRPESEIRPAKRQLREKKRVSYTYPYRGDSDVVKDPRIT